MAKKPCCRDRAVYRYEPAVPGMEWELWCGDDAAPHGNVSDIWNGATGAHVNGAPSFSGTHPDNTWSDNLLNPCGSGRAQTRAKTWVQIPAGGGFLRDNNNNTGERGAVYFGQCCGTLDLIQETTVNTPAADRVLLDPTAVSEGWLCVIVLLADFSANGGFDLEFSADGNTWANINGQSNDPKVECQILKGCDETPDGWSECKPDACCAPIEIIGGGGLDEAAVQELIDAQDHDDPAPSTLTPLPDNEADTAIRTGQVGTSLDYARADHNHPIRRQANPGDPVLTATTSAGSAMTQAIVLDRWSDEESYTYRFRTRWTVQAGTGWNFVSIPTKAGFQQPEISAIGTYRQTSNAPQDDDGNFGASPRGPFMGSEAHHWSSTNRVYLGHFRRDNNYTKFVEFTVKYTRL